MITAIVNLDRDVSPAELAAFRAMWRDLESDRQRHTLLTNFGATFTEIRPRCVPALVRRARALHR